ncbi:hypothetical protein IGI04_003097 [Brassica rapa subsp. trilocularis]|uniref:Uncharacterized protein n=1 Tax=Brassica rapa subsp. trilocularis TaxID=1813537 RepID=A0ABQ7NXG4_BRACM|nr:hypothetical protein IGI04_003097 [Brassica rapa subsp. trilocularis]
MRDKGKITVIVITTPNLSKWYITIFIILRNFQVSDQIYLRKYNLRDWLCVIALNNDKDRFLSVPRNKCLAFFLCLLKRIGRLCLRSCRRKKAFSMYCQTDCKTDCKKRRAATTSLISMYCQTDCKKDVCLVPVTATAIVRQTVEELLYIFGSAFFMEIENSDCLVVCSESLIALV